jgi:hypothetical protein
MNLSGFMDRTGPVAARVFPQTPSVTVMHVVWRPSRQLRPNMADALFIVASIFEVNERKGNSPI